MTASLDPDEDQRGIRDAASALLEAHYPVSRLREGGCDDLRELAAFGTFALAVPEARGGAGLGLVEEALVHRLLGRHLVSTRALAASLAARLAAALGEDGLADRVATGAARACAAVPVGGSLLLVEGDGADLAVVFGEGRLGLVALDGACGEPVPGLGHDLPLTRLARAASAEVRDSRDPALLDVAGILVAAQLLGNAEATRDLAVAYAGMRRQFGRPIGAFQAIKHRCADMAMAAEALSSLFDFAAVAAAEGRADAAFQVAALRLIAPRAALANARACIQVHGGIGFSAEADPHHYLKRAHLLARLLGASDLLALPAPLAPYTPAKRT